MLNLVRPEYFIPVHGEYRMLRRHGELGVAMGVLSDVTGLPVRVPEVKEATALGCAIAAGAGAGLFADMDSTGERLVKWSREFTPNPQHRGAVRRHDAKMAGSVRRPARAGGQRADHVDVAGTGAGAGSRAVKYAGWRCAYPAYGL